MSTRTDAALSDRDERAREYSRAKIIFFVAGTLVSWIGSFIFHISGSSARVTKSTTGAIKGNRTGEAATIIVLTLISWISSLPLSYLRGYRLEHRYGMSNQTHASWGIEQLKIMGLQLVLMVPITQLVLATIRRWPRNWWAILSGAAIPFTVLLAHLFPVLIAPIFNTYQPVRDQELARRLKELAARSGIHVAEIMEMDMSRQTKAANAMFAGIGSTKRIVLSDTLLENYSYEEIEAIVAHEIGHQANRDVWRLLAVGTITTAAIAWATQRVFEVIENRTRNRSGSRGPGSVEALPLLGLVGSVIGLALMPLQHAFVRYIERQADRYTLELTGNPDAFASALNRLKETNLANPDPSRIEEVLLHSHPRISERIAACERYAEEQRTA